MEPLPPRVIVFSPEFTDFDYCYDYSPKHYIHWYSRESAQYSDPDEGWSTTHTIPINVFLRAAKWVQLND